MSALHTTTWQCHYSLFSTHVKELVMHVPHHPHSHPDFCPSQLWKTYKSNCKYSSCWGVRGINWRRVSSPSYLAMLELDLLWLWAVNNVRIVSCKLDEDATWISLALIIDKDIDTCDSDQGGGAWKEWNGEDKEAMLIINYSTTLNLKLNKDQRYFLFFHVVVDAVTLSRLYRPSSLQPLPWWTSKDLGTKGFLRWQIHI